MILFTAAIHLLVKSAERPNRVMMSKVRQPPTRILMDTMIITTWLYSEGRWMLKHLEKLFTWATMTFKLIKKPGAKERQSGQ